MFSEHFPCLFLIFSDPTTKALILDLKQPKADFDNKKILPKRLKEPYSMFLPNIATNLLKKIILFDWEQKKSKKVLFSQQSGLYRFTERNMFCLILSSIKLISAQLFIKAVNHESEGKQLQQLLPHVMQSELRIWVGIDSDPGPTQSFFNTTFLCSLFKFRLYSF